MRAAPNAVRPSQPTEAAVGFGWPALKREVGEYLKGQGVPSGQAERFSQGIIAGCADHAKSIGVDRMDQRVLSEAQTLLEGWHAARRASLLTVA